MISFFRRALSSWIVLGLLGLIMIAFIVTGVGTPSGLGNISGGNGNALANIGNHKLTEAEVRQRAQTALQNIQQQQPEITMAAFVRQGGLESLVRQLIDAKSIELWAKEHGIAASKRLVDGEIASIPAFHGLSGKFDEGVFRNVLAQQRLSEAQLRGDMAGDAIRRQILIPVSGGLRAPQSLVLPYASLMMESRKGMIGIVPTELVGPGTAPTDADINGWYKRNIARYTMPERRVLRYAIISKSHLKQQPQVSDADIAAFYNANAAEYGASETRSFSQIVLPDEASAKAFAAKIKGGSSFVDAARAAGFAPTDILLGERKQPALAELTSPEIAKAAYATPQGGTTTPMKSALGWHILHVDTVKRAAPKPLASVRDAIAASLAKQKADEAIVDLISAIEDQIADGETFDEVAKAKGLTVATTPAILPNGTAPEDSGWRSPAELQVLLKPAFEGSPDDDPTVENIGNGELHALLKIDRIVPSAPIPLAKVKDRVTNDLMVDRASARAQAVAKSIIAKVDGGIPLTKAIAEADIKLPPPQPAGGRQIDLIQSGRQVPPPLALMFAMKSGQTRLLAAPEKRGWFIVRLDSITPGDANAVPGLVQSTQSEFSGMMADEFQQQFSAAVAKTVGVTRNDAALAQLKRALSGTGGQ